MAEDFRIIEEFPDYAVSNFGRVRTIAREIRYVHAVTGDEHYRISTERFLKVYLNDVTGYKFIQPYKDKARHNRTIHRLVAIAFIANPANLGYVNHIDGNKHNNVADNLEWCTNEYNHAHATLTGLKARGSGIGSSKLNERSAIAIKRMIEDGVSHGQIVKWFAVSRSAISQLHEGETWKGSPTGEELTIKQMA